MPSNHRFLEGGSKVAVVRALCPLALGWTIFHDIFSFCQPRWSKGSGHALVLESWFEVVRWALCTASGGTRNGGAYVNRPVLDASL